MADTTSETEAIVLGGGATTDGAAWATSAGCWARSITVGTAEPEKARTIIVSPARALWTSGLSARGAVWERSGAFSISWPATWPKPKALRCRPASRRGTGRKAFRRVALTSVSSSRRQRHLAQASRCVWTASALLLGQVAADVVAEPADGGPAVLAGLGLEVGLEVRLPEALAGPVGEGGHGVGLDADPAGHLGRGETLDLGQPQDRPPAGGQRLEGLADQVALEPHEGHVVGLGGCRRVSGIWSRRSMRRSRRSRSVAALRTQVSR